MLHELLLALSGHPSPLFSTKTDSNPLFSSLSPSEIVLLSSIAQLGNLHARIRDQCSTVSSSHPSVICRAVATAVVNTHLARFQKQIVNVERDLLLEDASLVGAYQVVPLSAIAGAFNGWSQKLEWLEMVIRFVHDVEVDEKSRLAKSPRSGARPATGAALIDNLRFETQTGYPEIEQTALDLAKVAELAWLRQVSTWIIYGRLPTLGASDFFIQETSNSDTQPISSAWEIRNDLCPSFLGLSTTYSILFIGKSINHIRTKDSLSVFRTNKQAHKPSTELPATPDSSEPSLLTSHLNLLASLSYPISSTAFARTISAIRTSLSQNALKKLLPLSEILQVLHVFREFFLLQRGEFAIALINAADSCLAAKSQRSVYTAKSSDNRMRGVMIRESEVATTLNQAWATLAALQDLDDDEDEELELARDLVHLSIKKAPQKRVMTSASVPSFDVKPELELKNLFGDLLLATPTILDLEISSPLDLFLTPDDTDVYSQVHAFLLSIRRAQVYLSDLWKLASLRREHSTNWTLRGKTKSTEKGRAGLRELTHQRARQMRKTWTTISLVTSFLVELGEYCHGEVVTKSWSTFESWLRPTAVPDQLSETLPTDSHDRHSSAERKITSPTVGLQPSHDPETLMVAHKAFLRSLAHALLLDDAGFTHSLRALLTRVDYIVGLMARLSDMRLLFATSENHATPQQTAEQDELMSSIDGACASIRKDMETSKVRLRELDTERLGENLEAVGFGEEGGMPFTPWRAAGLDRLLLKLDSGYSGD